MRAERSVQNVQDDFANVREAMSRYNGRGSYEERRLWFEEGTFSLQRIEEQLEVQRRALERIRDWAGFRHTGEVRDCAGKALDRSR